MSDNRAEVLPAAEANRDVYVRRRWLHYSLLAVIVLVGVAVRWQGMSTNTMTHEEIYIPGIVLPDGISNPHPRHTIPRIVTSTIHYECHPPGYYFFMLGWTKCFGTSLVSLRLPSLLFAVGSLALIYLLASQVGLAEAGLGAALIWAVQPLAVTMERFARPYALLCFLGLLSSLLLLKSYSSRGRGVALAAYVLVVLAGLAEEHYFWPILLAQLLFTLAGSTPTPGRLAPQTRWQLFTIVLGSPFLAIAGFQSWRPSYLPESVGGELLQYLQVLYAWSPFYYVHSPFPAPAWLSLSIALAVLGLALAGTWFLRRPAGLGTSPMAGPSGKLMCLAALVALAAIGLLTYECHRLITDKQVPYRAMILSGLIVPVALAIDPVVRRWPSILRPLSLTSQRLGPTHLLVLLAIVPVASVALVSLITPLFCERTVYAFGPYLLLVVCAGILGISERWLWRVPVLAGVVLVAVTGLTHDRPPRSDHVGFVQLVEPEAQPDDLWFIRPHQHTTPLFYHLKPEEHRFVGDDYERVLHENPQSRVWVVDIRYVTPKPQATKAVQNYRHVRRFDGSGISADLYAPPSYAGLPTPAAGDVQGEGLRR